MGDTYEAHARGKAWLVYAESRDEAKAKVCVLSKTPLYDIDVGHAYQDTYRGSIPVEVPTYRIVRDDKYRYLDTDAFGDVLWSESKERSWTGIYSRAAALAQDYNGRLELVQVSS